MKENVKWMVAMSLGHRKVSSYTTTIPDGLGGEGGVIDMSYFDKAIPKGEK